MPEVLTPESPQWEQFVSILEAVVEEHGCKGDAGMAGPEEARAGAKNTLKWMNAPRGGGCNFDVDATLKYFDDHGGHCDCEILLNVDPD